jgi:hypothetical protein
MVRDLYFQAESGKCRRPCFRGMPVIKITIVLLLISILLHVHSIEHYRDATDWIRKGAPTDDDEAGTRQQRHRKENCEELEVGIYPV